MRSIRQYMAAIVAAGCVMTVLAAQSGHAQTYRVLYTFTGNPNDGANPSAGVIQDAKGNLYGTTYNGGPDELGTVFRVSKTGHETVLYAFNDLSVANPLAGVTPDAKGNFYGTTSWSDFGNGTVFKLSKTGNLTVLYRFTGGKDGAGPGPGDVILDAKRNLYGTAEFGGNSCDGSFGCGVVFKLSQTGNETVLYKFCPASNCADGAEPYGGLIQDAKGNLYGTTVYGGDPSCMQASRGCGVVFKLSKAVKESVLHAFTGAADGAFPNTVILDAKGNLYGATGDGGDLSCGSGFGCGVVFNVGKTGKVHVLHAFTGGADGAYPDDLIVGANGNLYGTASGGGDLSCVQGGVRGCGVVFKLSKGGKETVLHSFRGTPDGSGPNGVILDAKGDLYGTTNTGGDLSCGYGSGCGVVFKLIP